MTDLDPNGLEAAARALNDRCAWDEWENLEQDEIRNVAEAAVRAYLAASAPSPSEPIPDYEFAAREEDRIAGAVAAERERIVKLLRERPGWMAGDIADLVERSAPSPSPPEPPTPCPECGGSGDRNGNLRASDPFGTCPGCDGRGIREAAAPSPPEPAPDVDAEKAGDRHMNDNPYPNASDTMHYELHTAWDEGYAEGFAAGRAAATPDLPDEDAVTAVVRVLNRTMDLTARERAAAVLAVAAAASPDPADEEATDG